MQKLKIQGTDGQNFQIKSKVKAGEVVIAVQGKNQETGSYNLQTNLMLGRLENPGSGSKHSGISLISGWTCSANRVEVEVDGQLMSANYNIDREDTRNVCGDSNNGFLTLINWNLLDRSRTNHTARLLVDGEELAQTSFTVTTFGEEFMRGASGETTVTDFPSSGNSFRLVWQQNQQNFRLAPLTSPNIQPKTIVPPSNARLEIPGHASFQSGIGLVSGWVCDARNVEVQIGRRTHTPIYGIDRKDTKTACNDANNGFVLMFNWNHITNGTHTAKLLVNGQVVDQSKFTVTKIGRGFVRNVQKTVEVPNFPRSGKKTTLEWQESLQNFVITNVSDM